MSGRPSYYHDLAAATDKEHGRRSNLLSRTSSTTGSTSLTEISDEQFIENEYAWPMWPNLFIKKRSARSREDMGFIYGNLDRKPGEPHRCYFNVNAYLDDLSNKEPVLMTSAEIVAAGWVVD